MILDKIHELSAFDAEIGAAVEAEYNRQRDGLELIASENVVSEAVLLAAGTILTNKYAEGCPAHRYYGGCIHVDEVEELARERAKKLFGAEHANVQPHCGSSANMAVYFAVLEPGDTILSMSLDQGGHLSHGSPVNFSGKLYNIVSYRVNEQTGMIDYENLRKQALEHHPKMIIAGASAYPRAIDFKIFREIYLLTTDYPYDSIYMLQHYMNNKFRNLDYQALSAAAILMSLVMIVIIGALFLVENHFGKDVEG